MKRYCIIFIFIFCLLCSSCVTTSVIDAQNITYYDRYYYGGYSYPVIYISSVPYYYHNRWVAVPHSHYCHIRHYRYPMSIRGTIPYSWRRYNHHEHYPRYRKYDRTHNYRINQRPSRGRK